MVRTFQRVLIAVSLAVALWSCGESGPAGVADESRTPRAASGPGSTNPDTSGTLPPDNETVPPTGPGPVVRVQVIPDTLFLRVGDHGQLRARGTNALGQIVLGTTTAWTSSDPAVATIQETGLVLGISPGTSTVTATIGGVSGTARVTVLTAAPPTPPPVTSFTLSGIVVGVEPGGDTTRTVRVPNAEVMLYRIGPADWWPVSSVEFHNPPLKEFVGRNTTGANGDFTFGTLSAAWYRAEVKAPAGSTYLDGASVISPPTQSTVTTTVILHQNR